MPDRGTPIAVVAAGDVGAGTAATLRLSHPDITILATSGPADVAAVANRAWDEHHCHLLIMCGGVDLPADALGPALAIVDGDPRVATVSFFSAGAGFLAFPRPRPGDPRPSTDLNPDTVTVALRTTSPDLDPAPLPFAIGPAVLVAAPARSAIGALATFDEPDGVGRMLVDYSLRGRRRGFSAVVDPSTFCRGPGGGFPASEPEATLAQEYGSPSSPLTIVHAAARAKVAGLHMLIDAARLSPQEMGTQVATVALIRALARRPDVARVCVALAGELPAYAASLRDDPKVDARVMPDRDFTPFGRVDVAHRPFQPDSPGDMDACHAVADRTAITMLDLIAYQAVSYQLAPEHWRTYRHWLRRSVTQVDAVIAPTHDVRLQMLRERLPVDPERLIVAELGTDHLTGEEQESAPAGLDADDDFVVVLGADYTHKNRDLAVRAHRELCDRGSDLTLVLAGTAVHGSSRALENEARSPDQRIVVLPDVTSEERNWLLRHASVVLYPTSGEGFGLVPFEAAAFGTPTAFVAFGPLAELAGPLPVHAEDWSPTSLADAAARLLDDPALARAQVEATHAAGDRYTWDAGAAKLAAAYRAVLARAPAVRAPRTVTVELDEVRDQLREARQAQDRMQRSQAYKLATRAGALRDALRNRARPRLR